MVNHYVAYKYFVYHKVNLHKYQLQKKIKLQKKHLDKFEYKKFKPVGQF